MTHVFSFGCPRTGTTVMEHVLRGLETVADADVVYQKIREADHLHPIGSDNGLLCLGELYRDEGSFFVRTYRDPVAIFESFYMMRRLTIEGKPPEETRSMRPLAGVRLDETTDDHIFEFIEAERMNTSIQVNAALPWPLRFVEVSYESLFTEEGQKAFVVDISRTAPLDTEHINHIEKELRVLWGKSPIREGRMSHGVTGTLLSDELRSEIRDRLGAI